MNTISLQVPEDIRETAIEQVVGSGETADEGVAQAGEDEGNTGWANAGPQQETAGRPGIDQVLRDVADNLGDQHADVIKGLQRDFTHHGEIESLKRQLRDAIGEFDSLKDEINQSPEDIPDPLEGVPDEQLQLLELALERGGYVKKDDLDEEARNGLIGESNEYGVKLFGESFGNILCHYHWVYQTSACSQTYRTSCQKPYLSFLVRSESLDTLLPRKGHSILVVIVFPY